MKEETIWNFMLAHKDIFLRVIVMPPDFSCFYHAIYTCLEYNKLNDLTIEPLFEKYKQQTANFFKHISTTYNDVPTPTEITYVHVLRFMIAVHVNENDFEQYQMLCLGEPDNPSYENVEKFRTGILFDKDYANQVIIQILLRILKNEYGIYILTEYGLSSCKEWHNKKWNFVLEFVGDNHYNVVQICSDYDLNFISNEDAMDIEDEYNSNNISSDEDLNKNMYPLVLNQKKLQELYLFVINEYKKHTHDIKNIQT